MKLPNKFYALVTEQNLRQSKNGGYYYRLILKTRFGFIKTNQWDVPITAHEDPRLPHVGDIIEVAKFKDQTNTEHNSIVLIPGQYKKIAKEDLPEKEKSICEFQQTDRTLIQWAFDTIKDKTIWDDPKHSEFTMACIKTYDSKKFLDCPAASQIHHAYPSGLLIHTAEVLSLCQGIYEASKEQYGFVDRDVLYSGAILHDIGKIETYRINEIGIAEKLPEERSTGHIYLGMRLVEKVGKEMDMAEDFTKEVIHCIAAHHGKIEYGSVKPVQSQEALIISCADLISSRNGKLEGKLQENVKSGLPLPPDFDIYRDHYYASIGMKKYIAKNQ